MSATQKDKVICFDVDGTLTTSNSWQDLAHELGVDRQELYRMYRGTRDGTLDFEETLEKTLRLFQKSSRSNEVEMANIFRSTMKPRPEIADLFRFLRNHDYSIYLVTAAPRNYINEILKVIPSVDGAYVHAEFFFDSQGELNRIHDQKNDGGQKVHDLEDIAAKHKIELADILFVGDSINDVEGFRATGNGIAMDTDNEKLLAVAWKQISNLMEIKEIVQNL